MDFVTIELIVSFERDIPDQVFPFLGHSLFLGAMDALLKDSTVRPLRMFMSVCASPEVKTYIEAAVENGTLAEAAIKPFPFCIKDPWYDPAEGWKTALEIRRMLSTKRADEAGLHGIVGELSDEADCLASLLGTAAERGTRFHFDFGNCTNPPAALVAYVEDELADTARVITECIKEENSP